MFRFSIRELLLVMLVAAVAGAWLLDRRILASRLDQFERRIAPFEEEFEIVVKYREEVSQWLTDREEERRMEGRRNSLVPPEVFDPGSPAEASASSTSSR